MPEIRPQSGSDRGEDFEKKELAATLNFGVQRGKLWPGAGGTDLSVTQRMMTSQTDPVTGARLADGGRPIPLPLEPLEPVLGSSAAGKSGERPPSILDVGTAVFPLAGRHAIYLALKASQVGPGARVLVPAYHCEAMVEPVLWAGAEPAFFNINEDLTVDMADLEARMGADVKAMLAVHYFGFEQDLAPVAELCAQRNVVLIEDCAHCFFGGDADRPIGSTGDFAIASLRKFFPLLEGGCLVSARSDLSGLHLRPDSLLSGLKGIYRMLDRATYYGRLPALAPVIHAVERARAKGTTVNGGGGEAAGVEPTAGDIRFPREAAERGIPALERLLLQRFNMDTLASRRVLSFRRIEAGLSGLPGCRPLRPHGHATAPYLFPLWVDDLTTRFAALEDAAIPMQRFGQFPWAGMNTDDFKVAGALSRHVVQISCHQSLTPTEVDEIVSRLHKVLAR